MCPQPDIVVYVCMPDPMPSGRNDVIQLRGPSFSMLPKLFVCKSHLPFAVTAGPSRCHFAIQHFQNLAHINFLNPP